MSTSPVKAVTGFRQRIAWEKGLLALDVGRITLPSCNPLSGHQYMSAAPRFRAGAQGDPEPPNQEECGLVPDWGSEQEQPKHPECL